MSNTISKVAALLGFLGLILLSIFFFGSMMETVGAGSIVVKQGAIDGSLTIWNQPGLQWQGWGTLTTYKRSDQFSFEKDTTSEGSMVKVRFNDFGEANVSGSLRYELPTDPDKMKRLHMTYGSQEAVERQLIQKAVNSAIYMTGPLMSSTEAASSRRAELLSLTEDQLKNGIYKQNHKDVKITDPITGQEKTTKVVELTRCTQGPLCVFGFERQEKSALGDFGITVFGLTYSGIEFENSVKQQIQRQQAVTASVQESMAHAKSAEQAALTAQKDGEAKVATAKANQAVLTATAVGEAERAKQVAITKAQQDREVAEQDAKAAAAEKTANILRGDGESYRAKANMAANGALEQKLDAYVKVQDAWAKALSNSQLVPQVMLGSSGGTQGSQFMELLMAKTARDLAIELTPRK